MITETEYKELKTKEKTWCEWVEQFRNKSGWFVIPENEKPPIEFTNEERSAIEKYEFLTEKPDKYFLYVNDKKLIHDEAGSYFTATTWTGEVLGRVSFGREYRSAFGDMRRSIKMTALNGVKYYGTYYKSAGTYARIKKCKKEN